MSNETGSSSGGFGLCGVLFVAFLVLKLCGVIAWSWWWVTAPLWIPAVIVIVVLAVFLIGFIMAMLIKSLKPKTKRMFTLIELFVVIAIISIFILICGSFAFAGRMAYRAHGAVKDKGIKGVAEEIWEGKDSTEKDADKNEDSNE